MTRWAGHVACMVEINSQKIWFENLRERDHSKGLGINGTII
jgi:hypothetical protein